MTTKKFVLILKKVMSKFQSNITMYAFRSNPVYRQRGVLSHFVFNLPLNFSHSLALQISQNLNFSQQYLPEVLNLGQQGAIYNFLSVKIKKGLA